MPSLGLQCASVFSIAGECVLRDEQCQAFGHRRRPGRRMLSEALLDSSKLRQKKVVATEFWSRPRNVPVSEKKAYCK